MRMSGVPSWDLESKPVFFPTVQSEGVKTNINSQDTDMMRLILIKGRSAILIASHGTSLWLFGL
jgi:hypothetical protein